MKNSIGARRYLKPALRALELLPAVYEPVLAATGAFACMLGIKQKLQTGLLVGEVIFKTFEPIPTFFCGHISILICPVLCCQGIPVELSTQKALRGFTRGL